MPALALFPTLRARKPRYTQAFQLTPQSLVDTAAHDIKRKRANWAAFPGPYEQLAFLPRHVRRGDCPADVLRRAYESLRRKSASSPSNAFGSWCESPQRKSPQRAALYGDVSVLKAALTIAEENGHRPQSNPAGEI